jgi:putative transposase
MQERTKPEQEERDRTDSLTDLIRAGAQQLIAQALKVEVAELLATYANQRDEQGHARVVLSGHHPPRAIQTGIGPVDGAGAQSAESPGRTSDLSFGAGPPVCAQDGQSGNGDPVVVLERDLHGRNAASSGSPGGARGQGAVASTVARLKQVWREEYAAWRQRQLDADQWASIWVDGIYRGLRAETQRLCALVVIGMNAHGEQQLLVMEDGIRESTQSWREVLLHLNARGLTDPALAIGDGALGFWAALEEIFPGTRHQRCWWHKTQNVLNALPKSVHPKAKQALQEIWRAATKGLAEQAFDVFLETYELNYPKATACLEKDREALLMFYTVPAAHWPSLRTTHPIESTFGTIRHRTARTKGCLTREGMRHMMCKLGQCAENTWRRLRGFKALPKVIAGIQLIDGIEQAHTDSVAA